MPISGEIKGAEELVADLRKIRERAVPYGMRNGLNTAAFEARRIWQREIKSSFTNRNQYTVRSVLVVQATVKTLEARVGSTTDYMRKQEEGGTVTGSSGKKPIPAPAAAGQAAGSGARTRLVRPSNWVNRLTVDHPTLTGNRKQRNAIRLAVARRAGHKTVLLERPNGSKGLFAVGGGKRKLTTRLLWVVGRSSVKVRPEPTLQRTLAVLKPKLEHMHKAAMVQQLQYIGVKAT